MKGNILLAKQAWLGIGTALVLVVFWLMLLALLLVRGLLPQSSAAIAMAVGFCLAAFLGGAIAGRGQGRQLCALLPGGAVYVLLWLVGLCSQRQIVFGGDGILTTASLMLGALFGWLRCGRGRKRRRIPAGKYTPPRVRRR